MSESTARKIWNPAIEHFDIKDTDVPSSSLAKFNQKNDQVPFTLQCSSVFPNFGALFPRFPQMPFLLPPLNPAVLSLCAKSMQQHHLYLQQQQQQQQQRVQKTVTKKNPSNENPSGKEQLVPDETFFSNPIVNAILNGEPCASDIRSINHNICAVCGESFRLTGDLVHHMRRERCRNLAPYNKNKPKRD